jgi:hypothetical protein
VWSRFNHSFGGRTVTIVNIVNVVNVVNVMNVVNVVNVVNLLAGEPSQTSASLTAP